MMNAYWMRYWFLDGTNRKSKSLSRSGLSKFSLTHTQISHWSIGAWKIPKNIIRRERLLLILKICACEWIQNEYIGTCDENGNVAISGPRYLGNTPEENKTRLKKDKFVKNMKNHLPVIMEEEEHSRALNPIGSFPRRNNSLKSISQNLPIPRPLNSSANNLLRTAPVSSKIYSNSSMSNYFGIGIESPLLNMMQTLNLSNGKLNNACFINQKSYPRHDQSNFNKNRLTNSSQSNITWDSNQNLLANNNTPDFGEYQVEDSRYASGIGGLSNHNLEYLPNVSNDNESARVNHDPWISKISLINSTMMLNDMRNHVIATNPQSYHENDMSYLNDPQISHGAHHYYQNDTTDDRLVRNFLPDNVTCDFTKVNQVSCNCKLRQLQELKPNTNQIDPNRFYEPNQVTMAAQNSVLRSSAPNFVPQRQNQYFSNTPSVGNQQLSNRKYYKNPNQRACRPILSRKNWFVLRLFLLFYDMSRFYLQFYIIILLSAKIVPKIEFSFICLSKISN